MSGSRWGEEETRNPVYADDRGFFKVEQWTAEGHHIACMLYAGNRIDRARAMFDAVIRFEPEWRYYIRQGIRVVAKWPKS